jgi:hypothetical protein
MATAAWCQEPVTWGNIAGRILSNSSPAAGASVCLTEFDKCTRSETNGSFLLSGIPLDSWDGRAFDLDASLGDRHARVTGLYVPPGASNTPELLFSFAVKGDTSIPSAAAIVSTTKPDNPTTPTPPARRMATEGASAIFATREGLVGRTTANGHVIVENDRFVALPSRRALNRTDSDSDLEFEVELRNGEATSRLPVWDVGPWNTKDDWWNVAAFRQNGQDLARGTPMSQAAFQFGYNGGLDLSGRVVKNPAGIDLADGAFWNDLGMKDNGTIEVRMLWQLDGTSGQRIRANHWAKVRATPGGTLLDTVECGAEGTLLSGPDSATISGHWYLFYKVEWDDGTASGWSAENFLDADTTRSCTVPVRGAVHNSPIARIVGNRLVVSPSTTPTEFVVFAPDGTVLARSTDSRTRGEWILPPATGIQFVSVQAGTHRQILTRLP